MSGIFYPQRTCFSSRDYLLDSSMLDTFQDTTSSRHRLSAYSERRHFPINSIQMLKNISTKMYKSTHKVTTDRLNMSKNGVLQQFYINCKISQLTFPLSWLWMYVRMRRGILTSVMMKEPLAIVPKWYRMVRSIAERMGVAGILDLFLKEKY